MKVSLFIHHLIMEYKHYKKKENSSFIPIVSYAISIIIIINVIHSLKSSRHCHLMCLTEWWLIYRMCMCCLNSYELVRHLTFKMKTHSFFYFSLPPTSTSTTEECKSSLKKTIVWWVMNHNINDGIICGCETPDNALFLSLFFFRSVLLHRTMPGYCCRLTTPDWQERTSESSEWKIYVKSYNPWEVKS